MLNCAHPKLRRPSGSQPTNLSALHFQLNLQPNPAATKVQEVLDRPGGQWRRTFSAAEYDSVRRNSIPVIRSRDLCGGPMHPLADSPMPCPVMSYAIS